jgi:CheY-like chemotaxis protein
MALFPRGVRWTPRTRPPQPATRRRRLLVVDDHLPSAEAISAALSIAGYDVQFIQGGHAVISVVRAWIPEIAVLDINMPEIDGFAVARELRKHEPTHAILIVAFTAHDESTIRAEGIAAGFDAYCQKGCAPESPLHLLEEIALRPI